MGFLGRVTAALAVAVLFAAAPAVALPVANTVVVNDLHAIGTPTSSSLLIDANEQMAAEDQVFPTGSAPAPCSLFLTTDNYPVVSKGSYVIASVLDQYGNPLVGAHVSFESPDLPSVGIVNGITGPSGQFGIQTNSDRLRSETWVVTLYGAAPVVRRRLLQAGPNEIALVTQLVTLTWQSSCSVVGDPQFTGLLGQSYQVHGTDNTHYNIISTPLFQYNALFSYLDHGECRKGTPCFAHPGNYFGATGAAIRDAATGKIDYVEIISGSVTDGLRVLLNNETVAVGATELPLGGGLYKLSVPSAFEAVLESSDFSLRVANSDWFLNQDVSLGVATLSAIGAYKAALKSGKASNDKIAELFNALPHGLLGQTWQDKVYANRWKHIEGLLFDYVLADGIFGTSFRFNRF